MELPRDLGAKMKSSVLLGAGSSIPAGYPSTRCLTGHVLSGSGVSRHSNETYRINGSRSIDDVTPLVKCVVRRFFKEVERYHELYCIAREVNYEDVFYLIYQVLADIRGEIENPAVRPFATKMKFDLTRLVRARSDISYKKLLIESLNYVSDLVSESLFKKADSTVHLKIFKEAVNSGFVDSISTLCHDTHFETYICEQGIKLSDGFSRAKNDVRFWKNEFKNEEIPFLKLHGSVNWFRLRPDGSNDWHEECIGIPLKLDNDRVTRLNGRYLTTVEDRPILLIGTFNKIPDYTRGIFRELHYRFRLSIQNTDRLIVCGYSFGDKGINSEIIQWYYAKCGRQLVIVDPNPCKVYQNARSAIRNKWKNWKKFGGLRIICKGLEDVEFNELFECA